VNLTIATDPTRPHLGGNAIEHDPYTHCPEAWRYLCRRFNPRNVLDVGCGNGQAMRWFRDHGVGAVGIDGLEANAELAADAGPVIVHDLTDGPIKLGGVDLVWCCEVVEHIDPRCVNDLLYTLCCGRVLAMTHATPGQGGHHHVNEQPEAYWVERIEARGLMLDRHVELYRALGGHYWQRTGLIFVRAGE
jgi:SAM-dependent methyltransferase